MSKREILFRGKSIENNEWVYGFIVNYYYEKESYILEFKGIESGETLYESVKVIPDTVGMFTGLTDKNGVKIFEGDLFKSNEICEIVWSFTNHAWYVFEPSDGKEAVVVESIMLCEYDKTYIEIIGNIHETKE